MSSSALWITTVPLVSLEAASMLQPKTAILAFSTCLTAPSASRCTTTPRTIWLSLSVPPMSFVTRTLSTLTLAGLGAEGMTLRHASATRPASSDS
jgi:hypothetical protein